MTMAVPPSSDSRCSEGARVFPTQYQKFSLSLRSAMTMLGATQTALVAGPVAVSMEKACGKAPCKLAAATTALSTLEGCCFLLTMNDGLTMREKIY